MSETPDGYAEVTISFRYPISLGNYPDNVTTLAQAVEFDHGEMAGDPNDWLFLGVGLDGEWDSLSISVSADAKSVQGSVPL